MNRVTYALALIAASGLVTACSISPSDKTLSSEEVSRDALSIRHYSDSYGTHRVVTIPAIGAPILIDESVHRGATGFIIRDTTTVGGNSISVTYVQNEARNETLVELPSGSGTQSRTLHGLVGQVSDDRLMTDVNSALAKHGQSLRHAARFDGLGQASEVCSIACLEFLLLDGIGYLVCYAGCLAAWTGTN